MKRKWIVHWIIVVIAVSMLLCTLVGCGQRNAVSAPSAAGGSGNPAGSNNGHLPATEAAAIDEYAENYLMEDAMEMEAGAYDQAANAKNTMSAAGKDEMYLPEEQDPDEYNTEEYKYLEENRFLSVRTSPFSTFAADVDTASYANIRRMALSGKPVEKDAVRIEEMINYFHYDYPEPEGKEPFSVTTEIADCPWNPDTKVLSIGLQAEKMDTETMPESNLIFLVDVSGSMDEYNKLPLVQRSFMTLVENLTENDRISMITYSSGEELMLDGVSGERKAQIMDALESLVASGSTNGEHALEMAYELAQKHFIEGGNNRIILATDGDFNVGITSEGDLTRLVKEKAKSGIFLSVLGYGMGNYKDNKMEAMADNGNGNYYYIDDVAEARKVLVEEAGGTLFTVAKDVKLQVEFNPAKIKGYRLIGYENRTMAAEDFSDDTKDGGEIGAGHQVTALYEIVMADSDFEIEEVDSKYSSETVGNSDEWLTVNVRYKEPDGEESNLLEYPVDDDQYLEKMSDNLSWACGVAQVGMLLKDSKYAGTSDYTEIRERLDQIADDDYKEEFVYMIRKLQ